MADRAVPVDRPPVDRDAFERAIREAGALALRDYREGSAATTRSWNKAGGSPVSEADMAVDALLKDRLGALLPEAAWLSEETADAPGRLNHDHVWIVDPIDGTRAFLRGWAGWCVSAALVRGGRPVMAALHAPKLDAFYIAHEGEGAFLNGERLSVGDRETLTGARKPAHQLSKAEHDLIAVGCPNSIALRIAMVAAGEADLVDTQRWGAEWDIAAAHLIAQEAGAVVTDIGGHPIRYNQPRPRVLGVLAALPGLHAPMLDRLAPTLLKIMAQKDEEAGS